MHLPLVGLDSDPNVLAAIDEAAARAGHSAFVEDLGSGRTRSACLEQGAFAESNWNAHTALGLILSFISPDEGQPAAGDTDRWERPIRDRAIARFDRAYRDAAATDRDPHVTDPGADPVKLTDRSTEHAAPPPTRSDSR